MFMLLRITTLGFPVLSSHYKNIKYIKKSSDAFEVKKHHVSFSQVRDCIPRGQNEAEVDRNATSREV